MSKREHNKSGSFTLSLLLNEDKTLEDWEDIVNSRSQRKSGYNLCSILCPDQSDCILMTNQKGTLSVKSKHVAYGYQIIAFNKFGRQEMSNVSSTKTENDALTISHLCGTINCINSDHLIIETKKENDERTHCHFAMKNLYESSGEIAVRQFFENQGCPHDPPCGTINPD